MFVRDVEFQNVERWVANFTNKELVEQIDMVEQILNFDNANNFVFLDELDLLRMLLRNECVERVRRTSQVVLERNA